MIRLLRLHNTTVEDIFVVEYSSDNAVCVENLGAFKVAGGFGIA